MTFSAQAAMDGGGETQAPWPPLRRAWSSPAVRHPLSAAAWSFHLQGLREISRLRSTTQLKGHRTGSLVTEPASASK